MRNRLDRSPALSRLIAFVSKSLAARRGIVPVVGIAIAFVGFVLLLVNVFAAVVVIELLGVLFQGLGILLALIGLLLSEPLGR